MNSISYGLDEAQEEAIKWAIRNTECHIRSLEFNIGIDKSRLEVGMTRQDGNLRSRVKHRLNHSKLRLEELRKHREALKGLVGE